jgi:hypothetical protein
MQSQRAPKRQERVAAGYQKAYSRVWTAGYEDDIVWALDLADVEPDAHYVFSETAWVIVNSGFRYAVARKLWPAMRQAFRRFDPAAVMRDQNDVRAKALSVLNYPRKIDAILHIAKLIALSDDGLEHIIRDAQEPPRLCRLPFIGPVTCWHLAKVLGVDCVKPDVHLMRAAEAAGYKTPLALCEAIRETEDHRLTVVDSVLWRYGEQRQARGWDDWKALFAVEQRK